MRLAINSVIRHATLRRRLHNLELFNEFKKVIINSLFFLCIF
jgi:hypothetical protein